CNVQALSFPLLHDKITLFNAVYLSAIRLGQPARPHPAPPPECILLDRAQRNWDCASPRSWSSPPELLGRFTRLRRGPLPPVRQCDQSALGTSAPAAPSSIEQGGV